VKTDEALSTALREALRGNSTVSLTAPDDVRDRLASIRRSLLRNPVPDSSVDHMLVVRGSDESWYRLRGPTEIGAAADNELCLDSPFVSGRHCRIESDGDVWGVRNLGAKNGVVVNGERVETRPLRDGDVIRVGDVTLVFVSRAEELPEE